MQDLIKILTLISRFKQVMRNSFVGNKQAGEMRFENDAEHSFELALVAWYLIESRKLPLDTMKVIKYELVHDLVEAYAGDFDAFIHTENESVAQLKHDKEQEALKQLEKEFMDFPEMIEFIKAYESRNDEESVFVYALDKLIADAGLACIVGITPKEFGHSKEVVHERFKSKTYQSQHLKPIAEELLKHIDGIEDFYSTINNPKDFRK